LLRARDLELGKNRELTGTLYDLEARNKGKEDNI